MIFFVGSNTLTIRELLTREIEEEMAFIYVHDGFSDNNYCELMYIHTLCRWIQFHRDRLLQTVKVVAAL